VGGSQLIADKVAAILGNRIVLNSPVRRIDRGTSGVTVVSDQMTVTAKRVIVAVPPTLAGRIDYQPILPFEREQLMQRYNQGTLTKVAAVYNRPFWRDAGLSGTALDTGGPVSATFDDSPPSGSPGVVFGFVGGDKHASTTPRRPRTGAPQCCPSSRPSSEIRPRTRRLIRNQLERRAMDARVPGRDPEHGHLAGLRPLDPSPHRPHPLGRDRDVDVLERLHGRRGALRRTRREGGAGWALER
jgi:hypothetical protein